MINKNTTLEYLMKLEWFNDVKKKTDDLPNDTKYTF